LPARSSDEDCTYCTLDAETLDNSRLNSCLRSVSFFIRNHGCPPLADRKRRIETLRDETAGHGSEVCSAYRHKQFHHRARFVVNTAQLGLSELNGWPLREISSQRPSWITASGSRHTLDRIYILKDRTVQVCATTAWAGMPC